MMRQIDANELIQKVQECCSKLPEAIMEKALEDLEKGIGEITLLVHKSEEKSLPGILNGYYRRLKKNAKRASVKEIQTMLHIDSHPMKVIVRKMRGFASKELSFDAFCTCLKICVPEIQKSKEFEERAFYIFSFFDYNMTKSVSKDKLTSAFELLYSWKPKTQSSAPHSLLLMNPVQRPEEQDSGEEESKESESEEEAKSQSRKPMRKIPEDTPPDKTSTDNFKSAEKSRIELTATRQAPSPNYYSPSQILPPAERSYDRAFASLKILSQKSGLNKLNAYEIVSTLKTYYSGKMITKPIFIQMIQKKYLRQPEYHIKAQREYLGKFFDLFDTGIGACSTELAKGVLILCGGSLRDKIEAMGLLSQKFGISHLEPNELAEIMESAFKLYQRFDEETLEKLNATPQELALRASSKCWNDTCTPFVEGITPKQMGKWIGCRDAESFPDPSNSFLKMDRRNQLQNAYHNSLYSILRNISLSSIMHEVSVEKTLEIACTLVSGKTALSNFVDPELSDKEPPEASREKLASQMLRAYQSVAWGSGSMKEVGATFILLASGTMVEKLKAMFTLLGEERGLSLPNLKSLLKASFASMAIKRRQPLSIDFDKLASEVSSRCFNNLHKSLESDFISIPEMLLWIRERQPLLF